ncbi:MAG: hypothetical protein ACLFR1_11170 [Spirochaetia bacterium]
MTRREGLLLLLFLALIAAAGLLLFAFPGNREQGEDSLALDALENSIQEITLHPELASSLPDVIERLETRIAEAQSMLYTEGEIDSFQFGAEIRGMLVARGLTVERYQAVPGTDGRIFEFNVSGDALSFFRFLAVLEERDKLLTIPSLTVQQRPHGMVTGVFRIGYVEIP